MADAISEQTCVTRHETYPDLEPDLYSEFQRRRVQSAANLVRPGDKVLDVGCNSGYAVRFLPKSCEVHGIDVNPALVEIAAKRMKTAQVARAEAIPFPNKFFDVAIVSEILEHVYNPKRVLKEAVRVSRRAVIGDTPHESGTWGIHRVESHDYHVRCFTEKTLRDLLQQFGKVLSISTVDHDKIPQVYVFHLDVS